MEILLNGFLLVSGELLYSVLALFQLLTQCFHFALHLAIVISQLLDLLLQSILAGVGEHHLLEVLHFILQFLQLLFQEGIALLELIIIMAVLPDEILGLPQSHADNLIVIFEHADVLGVGVGIEVLLHIEIEGGLGDGWGERMVVFRHAFISKINYLFSHTNP